MVDDQSMNEWQDGFLVKGPGGSFTRVQNDESLDVVSNTSVDTIPLTKPAPSNQPVTPRQTIKPNNSISTPAPFRPSPPVKELGVAPVPFIDASDEEEIQKHAAELQKMVVQAAPDPAVTVQSVVDQVIRKHQLTFESELMHKRFAKVIESYLRGLRSALEVEDVLQRQTKIGGLGFNALVATAVIESVTALSDRKGASISAIPPMPAKKTEVKPVPSKENYPAPPPAFVPRPGGATPAPVAKPAMPADMAAALAAIKPPVAPTPPAPVVPPVPQPPVRPAQPIPEQPAPVAPNHELYGQSDQVMPRIRQTMRTDKPQMIDIRQPAGVVGPVEEIHQIDLQEFRRLAANPTESADKVYEKIELLEEESWEMRMQAVQAWRTSPLFQLYLAIGRESMEQNVPIGDIIRKRRDAQQPFILAEEFFAINALNARLVT